MSDDLIKRSDAIKALRKLGHEVVVIDKVCSLGVAAEFIDAIRAIPSAGRPQGEWIDDGLDAIGAMGVEYRWHKCSQCGFRISKSPSAYYPNFCEACGARMKGADDETD